MKKLSFILFIAFVFCSCQKTEVKITSSATLKSIVAKTNGVYNTTSICTSGSGVSGYTTDTFYNVSLVVASLNDTTLYVNNRQLFFAGDISKKHYYFYSPSSGGGYNLLMDSTLTTLEFS